MLLQILFNGLDRTIEDNINQGYFYIFLEIS